MNILSWFASIVAGGLALMMTAVSWRVLKGNPVLDNPVIHVAVGVLTFIGLRYRPDGWIGTILLGYEAVAISILLLLLWMAFQKACQAQKERKQEAKIARQSSQLLEGQQDHKMTKTQSSRRDIQRPKD